MNTGRAEHTATVLGTDLYAKVLVTGGSGDPSAELYDPSTKQWTYTAPMDTARSRHAAALLSDGRVLIVGGALGGDSWQLYDPANGWTTSKSLPFPGTHKDGYVVATRLNSGPNSGKVLATGPFGEAYLFDPSVNHNSWSPAPVLRVSEAAYTQTLLDNGA